MSALDLENVARRVREEVGHGAVLAVDTESPQPGLTIDPERMTEVALVLRDACGFDRLLNVAGIDHEGYDESGKGKHRKIAQYAEDGTVEVVTDPGTGDLGVVYHQIGRASCRERVSFTV